MSDRRGCIRDSARCGRCGEPFTKKNFDVKARVECKDGTIVPVGVARDD